MQPLENIEKRAVFGGVVTKKCPGDNAALCDIFPPMKAKFLSLKDRNSYHSLEDVVGCKWSAGVVAAIAQGVQRPGELERFLPGISTKILNERLRKLQEYRIILRTEHPGLPARVEYTLTPSGKKLAAILDQLRDLNAEHETPENETTS